MSAVIWSPASRAESIFAIAGSSLSQLVRPTCLKWYISDLMPVAAGILRKSSIASRKVSSSFLICEIYNPSYSAATRQSSVSSSVEAKLAGTYSSAELTPTAPSSMACRTSSFIESISSAVGGRLSYPTVWILTVAVPIKEAMFVETPLFSRYSRYSPSVVHSISYFMSPCEAFNSLFMLSLQGPHESPSPSTSRVTP